MSDGHGRLSAEDLRRAGCTCEFGCRNCGFALASMGNCPAWDPCPVGRAQNAACPLLSSGDQQGGES